MPGWYREIAMLSRKQAALVDDDLFEFLTEMETRKALRLRYPVSVVALLVPPQDAESADRSGLVERVTAAIRRVLRSTDAVAYHPTLRSFRILLVDASLKEAAAVIERIADELPEVGPFRSGAA